MKKNTEQTAQATQATQAQETSVATVTTNHNGNEIVTFTKSMFSAERLGYESSVLERGENGGVMVKLLSDNGDTIEKEIFVEDTTAYDAIESFAKLRDFDHVEDVAKCYYISKTAPLSDASGFKSVGAFLSMQFGLDASTVNNYRTIGDLFIVENERTDKDGKPIFDENGNKLSDVDWKYSWCKGWKISNVSQAMSIIRSCKDENGNISPEVLFEQYVKTGKLTLDAKQPIVKEQVNKIRGNGGNGKGKGKEKGKDENKTETPKQTVASMWSSVKESMYAYDLSDDEITLAQEACKTIERILTNHGAIH